MTVSPPYFAGAPTPTSPYGVSQPSTLPSGNAQTAITRGASGQLVCTFGVTLSPSSVATLTTAGQAITPIGGTGALVSVATTDLVYVNKPTHQAGLWHGNVSAAAANSVTVNVGNMTAGFLTPTTSQNWGVVALKGFPVLTLTISPSAIGPATTAEQQFGLTGIRAGEVVQVNKPTNQAGLDIVGVRAVQDGVLGITFCNVTTGTTITPTAGEAYTAISLGSVNPAGNLVTYQVSIASVASVGVTAAATGSYNITVSNLALTDALVGVTKPTNQSGIIAAGGKVSSAGVLAVFVANVTSGTVVTPTANEVWNAAITRPAPVAPLVVYTTTITPASITVLSSAEQTFVCTGLIATTPVWVNGPAQPAGVGIGGVRVSSTNNVGINFINVTSANWLTPTAGTYYVADFQMPIDNGGNSILQPAAFVTDQIEVLSNAIRGVLVNLGWAAGA